MEKEMILKTLLSKERGISVPVMKKIKKRYNISYAKLMEECQ